MAVLASRPVVGSSRKRTGGSVMSSIPMLVLFRSPPDTPRINSVPTYKQKKSGICNYLLWNSGLTKPMKSRPFHFQCPIRGLLEPAADDGSDTKGTVEDHVAVSSLIFSSARHLWHRETKMTLTRAMMRPEQPEAALVIGDALRG